MEFLDGIPFLRCLIARGISSRSFFFFPPRNVLPCPPCTHLGTVSKCSNYLPLVRALLSPARNPLQFPTPSFYLLEKLGLYAMNIGSGTAEPPVCGFRCHSPGTDEFPHTMRNLDRDFFFMDRRKIQRL